MERQFKINPEVNAKLDAFMQAEPGLVQFVKELTARTTGKEISTSQDAGSGPTAGLLGQSQNLAGEARAGGLGEKHQVNDQPKHEAGETGAGNSDPSEELHSQSRHQAELTSNKVAPVTNW
jgi:hypothetical protein